MNQQHVLLAFKLYGAVPTHHFFPTTPASLIDITPTILDYLHIASPLRDGVSLLPILQQAKSTIEQRPLFFETGLTTMGLLTASPNVDNILSDNINYYTTSKAQNTLVLKQEVIPQIIHGKQRAVLIWPWLLARYPNHNAAPSYILLNMETGAWTDQLNSSWAHTAPTKSLLDTLKAFLQTGIN